MKFILSKFSNSKIFLLDASGALVTIIQLSLIFIFQEYFGMPKYPLAIFIGIASVLFFYSTTIYLINPLRWKIYLRIVALLNISYCVFTFYHVLQFFEVLTLLGKLYFAGEIFVILVLSIYEFRIAAQTTKS